MAVGLVEVVDADGYKPGTLPARDSRTMAAGVDWVDDSDDDVVFAAMLH